MEIQEQLDRLVNLGFEVTLDWNEQFFIYYNANDVFPSTAHQVLILNSYFMRNKVDYTYSEMIISCISFFNHWYNNNLDIINRFDQYYNQASLEQLELSCLGDITKRVNRDLGLEGILYIDDDQY